MHSHHRFSYCCPTPLPVLPSLSYYYFFFFSLNGPNLFFLQTPSLFLLVPGLLFHILIIPYFFLFKNNFIYLFLFVAWSWWLHGLFSSCGERGTGLSLWGFSCYRARALGLLDVSSWSTWAQQALLTGCRAQAQQLRCADPVAPRHVGSS